ncbi:MAG: biliverdin-producing heme oxygenase [Flammeovirgaceae bacterium]
MVDQKKAPAISVMEKLKVATSRLHQNVETLAHVGEIMSGTLSLESYHKLIVKNYIFHMIVEEAIIKALSEFELQKIQFMERRKIGYLYEDLSEQYAFEKQTAFVNALEEEIQSKSHLYRIQNLFEAIGALYVLEGATLGGNIIKRELSKNHSIVKHTSFHYYGCYGKKQAFMWKSFREQAENIVQDATAEEYAINAAKKTFQFMARILNDY